MLPSPVLPSPRLPAFPRASSVAPGPAALWCLRALAVAAVAAGLLLAGGGPVAAHTGLQTSTPANGEALTQAPQAISLTFTEAVRPQFSQVAVTGPDGAPVTTGAAAFDGPVIRQPVSIDADGAYVVAYRVIGDDGHPVSGQVTFTVTLPDTGTSTEAAPGTEPAASSAPAPRADTAAASPAADDQGGPWWWPTLAAAAILAAGAAALVRRRRSTGG